MPGNFGFMAHNVHHGGSGTRDSVHSIGEWVEFRPDLELIIGVPGLPSEVGSLAIL